LFEEPLRKKMKEMIRHIKKHVIRGLIEEALKAIMSGGIIGPTELK
jgi:hypothetical protein